jgi:hypothetical protein
MSTSRSVPPQRVPTLTEVVDIPAAEPSGDAPPIAAGDTVHASKAEADVAPAGATHAFALPEISEQQLTQRVLADLQRQIDLILEQRVREAMAPALARLTDALVRDAREQLAVVLRDVVARAVAQELSRHRGR